MHSHLHPAVAILGACCALAAQAPRQLLDIRQPTQTVSSSPTDLTRSGATIFFTATGLSGRELYRTLGGVGGASLVADLAPGSTGSNPSALTPFGGGVYFVADDTVSGRELWYSDGTATGTRLIADLVAGSGGANPRSLTPYGTDLYFVATPQTVLWRTNGTTAGTTPVAGAPATGEVATAAGRLFFIGYDGFDWGLWTIGAAGIPSELQSFPNNARSLTGTGSRLYFVADDGVSGLELWTSDGTAPGTRRVADIAPGAASSNPTTLTPSGNSLFFAATEPTRGNELWVTDGTTAGTRAVTDLNPGPAGSAPTELVAFAGGVVFRADDGSGNGLWRTDGTAAGTVLLRANSTALGLHAIATDVFFRDLIDGELWATDGTPGGTRRVVEFFAGPRGGNPGGFVVHASNRSVVFAADRPVSGRELFVSDGTALGTVLLDDLNTAPLSGSTDSDPAEFTALFGGGLFTADDGVLGRELWFTNGTAAGTTLTLDARVGPAGADPRELTRVGAQVLYSAETDANGRELWCSDGTAAGTRLVRDIFPGVLPSIPSELTAAGGYAWFSADDGSGRELWRSDGTAAGTAMVADLEPVGGSAPRFLVALQDRVLFFAYTLAIGLELWESDGTPGGTQAVKDINPGSGSTFPQAMVAAENRAYFIASIGTSTGLWTTDGTAQGTINLTQGTAGRIIAPFGAAVLFVVSKLSGPELWYTNGTRINTRLVAGLGPGVLGPHSWAGASAGGFVYFAVPDPTLGTELWRSDGTVAGTTRITDLRHGDVDPQAIPITAAGDRHVYFAVRTTTDVELWRTDGTAAGTTQLGPAFYSVGNSRGQRASFALIDGRILFAADGPAGSGVAGIEPWVFDPGATAQPWPVACPLGTRPTLTASDPVLGSTAGIRLVQSTPATAAAILVSAALPPVRLPASTCALVVDPFSALATVGTGGSLTASAPVPAQQILQGLRVALQGATLSTAGLSISDGIYWTLGR